MTLEDRRLVQTDDPVIVALVVARDDHEERIRAGEKFRYTATGAIAVLAFAFPTTVAAVVAVLSNGAAT